MIETKITRSDTVLYRHESTYTSYFDFLETINTLFNRYYVVASVCRSSTVSQYYYLFDNTMGTLTSPSFLERM